MGLHYEEVSLRVNFLVDAVVKDGATLSDRNVECRVSIHFKHSIEFSS